MDEPLYVLSYSKSEEIRELIRKAKGFPDLQAAVLELIAALPTQRDPDRYAW